ncbi:glycosyltransferase [Elusimicrobiota bacterium]
MKILVLADIYPSPEAPVRGIFVREQVKQIRKQHDVQVMVIERRFLRLFSADCLRLIFRCTGIEKSNRIFGKTRRKDLRVAYPVFVVGGQPLHFINGFSAFYSTLRRLQESTFRPDLIFAFKSFPAGYVGWRMKPRLQVPVVTMEFMGPFSTYFAEPHRGRMVIEAINGIDRTIYSRFQLKEIEAYGVRKDKLGFGHFGVDVERFCPDRSGSDRRGRVLDSGKFKLLVIGRIEEQKGIQHLIGAMGILKRDFPGVRLTIVGPVDEGGEKILASIEKMGLAEEVQYEGVCPNKNLPSLINDHDILVSPSLFETLGLTIIEAFACGKPVVATMSGGPQETINERVGLLVNKADANALAAGLRYVMDNYSKYDPKEIRDYAVQNFSYEVVTQRLINLFEELLQMRGRSRRGQMPGQNPG